jgi:hypothetical protein
VEFDKNKAGGGMWNLWRNNRACEVFLDAAENVAVRSSGTLTCENLLDEIPAKFRSHLQDCEACAQTIDDLVTTRNSMQEHGAPATFDTPWFAARVMARISAEERMPAGQDAVWSVLPRLASRFAGIAVIIIVMTGGWLMRQPAEGPGSQNTMESLFDTSPAPVTNDDVLISVLEKAR